MAARNTDDNEGKAPATTPHVNMFLASACLDNSIWTNERTYSLRSMRDFLERFKVQEIRIH